MKRIVFLVFISFLSSPVFSQKALHYGIKFKQSAEVDSSHYKINSKKKKKPVITVQGNNITLDFKGATLQGSNDKNLPDQFYGTAIQIKKGKNITIRNVKIRGYRTAIAATNIEGLKIEDCDFSDNSRISLEGYQFFYRIHALSDFTINAQLANAIKLNNCKGVEISGCKARANANVVAMENCTQSIIHNNDFSFNSGAALMLNSSSQIQVLYNRFNFNVADSLLPSASLVISGNSHSNLIYKNSITHAANGISITTHASRNRKGDDIRNIIMENDLSYSIQSGIYSFYSDATLNKNRIYQSGYGVMSISPGNQIISNNQFRYNQTAIDISGSGTATIHHNIFFEDATALKLFSHENHEDNRTGYRKAFIVGNSFNRNRLVFHLGSIDSLAEFTNIYQQYDTLYWPENAERSINLPESEDLLVALSEDLVPVPKMNQSQNPFKGNGRFAGRQYLVPGKWGPYDYSFPLAKVNAIDSAGLIHISILGPEGDWSVKEIRGYEVVTVSGKELPGTLVIKKTAGSGQVLQLEFKDASGIRKPVVFSPF
jgi:hypothetical protein